MILTPISPCKVAGSQSCSHGDWQGKFVIKLATLYIKKRGWAQIPQPLAQEALGTKKEVTAVGRRGAGLHLSLIHISEPTRPITTSRMPSSA